MWEVWLRVCPIMGESNCGKAGVNKKTCIKLDTFVFMIFDGQ